MPKFSIKANIGATSFDEASIRAILKPKAPTHNKDMKPVVQDRVRELEAA
ncbi:hypothetical protein [Acetobacter sp.]|jgi:hypothetical protein|nr:hypothetical protein [Acetobacter sp.]MCH4090726.1 hypothetical protein [Acetobacter sp.]MCI1300558.1 hypothetical protein [Acetobacter sp.]MCI1316240.1 hypothetical protein [Acetobacter sp.]